MFIVAAKRTAFGDFGGKLKDRTATELGAIATKAALGQLPKDVPVSSVVFGNVLQTSACAPYLARHVALRCGLPVTTPALTVNRLCGSGFETVALAVREILCGDAEVVVAGGSENMSQSPFIMRDGRFGIRYGVEPRLQDSLVVTLTDQYPKPTPMGVTAENLAEKHGISRRQCDEFAAQSHQRWFKGKFSGIGVE